MNAPHGTPAKRNRSGGSRGRRSAQTWASHARGWRCWNLNATRGVRQGASQLADAMRILVCAPLTATVTLVATAALSLLPSAAEPAPGKARAEDSVPAQAIPQAIPQATPQATPQAIPQAAPQAAAQSEVPAETRRLGSVLGIEVRTSAEQNVGRIVDLLASRGGQVEAAVIEFGGFLGMGSRKI